MGWNEPKKEEKGKGENMNLFQMGKFTLHSGERSKWKIDCDALTDEDYETLAWIVAREWNLCYSGVISIPTGGNKFAEKLRKYKYDWWEYKTVLIVDDVLTTGKSFEKEREKWNLPDAIGVVVFARGECPNWVKPIFQYTEAKK